MNKHIPYEYKCNSRQIRLAVLAGIIDSDGYYNRNCYDIVLKSEKLIESSLGRFELINENIENDKL